VVTRTLTSRLAAALVVLAAASGQAQDYPQWRGPMRDGSAAGFTAPAAWPETLTRRWRAEVGEGYSTPLVIGNTVYAFARRGDQEVLGALDTESGAERWSSGYRAPYTASTPAIEHGAGPKATPLFHNGRIFTLGITGILTAFDPSTGKRLWQTSRPDEDPYYGAAISPLGEGELVIGHPGSYGPLTAFDAATGRVRWRAGPGGFFASPIAVDLDGVRQIVTATAVSIIGVSLDGRVLWQFKWDGAAGSTTPVFHEGLVIVAGPDRGMVALRPSLRDGRWSVEQAWHTREVSMYTANPVMIGGTIFGLATRSLGSFFALDAASGRSLWFGEPRAAEHTSLAKAGDLLFFLNDDGEFIVARASQTTFDPVARYSVADTPTWAQPAISGNRIFVKDQTSVTLWTID
jgi:outer membrane protein assembly factor BamB